MKIENKWLVFVLGSTVTFLCIFKLAVGFDRNAVLASMSRAGVNGVAGAVVLYLIGFVLRGLRWSLMLRDLRAIPVRTCIRSSILGYAANNILPFRLGEFVRATTFSRGSDLPLPTTLASIFLERIFDAFALIAILTAALALAGVSHSSGRYDNLFIGLTTIGAFIICALVVLLGTILLLSVPSVRRLIPEKLLSFTRKLTDAGVFLRSPARIGGVGILSLLVWLWEGTMFVLLCSKIGVQNPWITGYLMLGVVNLGILIPSTPGYIGVFQAAAVLAGGIANVPETEAIAVGILVHVSQFVPVTTLGLYLGRSHWKDLIKKSTPHA